jgi:hypothetical protein
MVGHVGLYCIQIIPQNKLQKYNISINRMREYFLIIS